MRLVEDGEIRIEQANDEIYSVCLHIGVIYFLTVYKLYYINSLKVYTIKKNI